MNETHLRDLAKYNIFTTRYLQEKLFINMPLISIADSGEEKVPRASRSAARTVFLSEKAGGGSGGPRRFPGNSQKGKRAYMPNDP
ncbi:hypothetical protein G7Y89_g8061 [Cudoniella acicularis]|uniref:Uncharacterized protein n=1 Tax=Cudoniella acicularis TaxID=354080 RepID=A0A8H4RHC0_9HELO|nr:hypothetical protein G7Y89_g8061 [Cudoniella acicularis]